MATWDVLMATWDISMTIWDVLMAIWNTVWSIGIFGMLLQDKSGIPVYFAEILRKDCLLHLVTAPSRVARWHIFQPKIPICVNFGG
jgi:hypothetical protein